MMQQNQSATLVTIFSDVLASLAFMFTEDEEGELLPREVWLETTIGYRGPASGVLRFQCTRAFSILLAANLLGVTPPDDTAESKGDDAVKEFMNIVCGQLITALHGTESVFDLTIPQIRELAAVPDFSGDGRGGTARLSVDGHRVGLSHTPT